jgi:hypothetical protein
MPIQTTTVERFNCSREVYMKRLIGLFIILGLAFITQGCAVYPYGRSLAYTGYSSGYGYGYQPYGYQTYGYYRNQPYGNFGWSGQHHGWGGGYAWNGGGEHGWNGSRHGWNGGGEHGWNGGGGHAWNGGGFGGNGHGRRHM